MNVCVLQIAGWVMTVRFNITVDQAALMDGWVKVQWYPSKDGEWVRYTDYAELEKSVEYWQGYALFCDDCRDAQEMYEEDSGLKEPKP